MDGWGRDGRKEAVRGREGGRGNEQARERGRGGCACGVGMGIKRKARRGRKN